MLYDSPNFVHGCLLAGVFVGYIIFEIFVSDSLPLWIRAIILIGLMLFSGVLIIKIFSSDLYKRLIIKRKFKSFIKNYYSNSERYLVELDKTVARFLHYEGFRNSDPEFRTPYPDEKDVYIHFERYLYYTVHNYYEVINFQNKALRINLANQMHAIYDKYVNYLFLYGYIKQSDMETKVNTLNKEIIEYYHIKSN